jgi:hypothetical protein
LKVKVLETELKVGSLRRTISSVNILPFRYQLHCEGVNITCQLCDEQNCICLEEIIFINKNKLDAWAKDDNYIIQELLIRLGLQEYSNKKQGNKDISK